MAKHSQQKATNGSNGFRFSPKAEGYLRAAQWSRTRVVPIDCFETAFHGEGLTLHPAAIQFLQHFGGLIIKYTTPADQPDVLEFRADDAVRGLGKAGLAQLESLFGQNQLCPLGHYQYGTCLLLQAPDRAVFGVSDDALSRLGGSGEEAINAILIGLEPELIDSEVAESSHHRKQ